MSRSSARRATVRRAARYALAALPLLPAAYAQTQDNGLCGFEESCPSSTHYEAIYPAASGDRCSQKYCPSRDDPVPYVLLQCYRDFGGYDCEAWPQGEELTYGWSSTGYVRIDGPLSDTSPVRHATCSSTGLNRGGSIQVTVTGPNGLSKSESVSVSCGWDDIR